MHEVVRQCSTLAAGVSAPLLMSVNCMNLRDPRAVYLHLLGGLTAPASGNTELGAGNGAAGEGGDPIMRPRPVASGRGPSDPLTELRRLVTGGEGGPGKVVAVLDELDQLLSGSNGQARAKKALGPSWPLLLVSPPLDQSAKIETLSEVPLLRSCAGFCGVTDCFSSGAVRPVGAAVPARLAAAAHRHCQLHRPHRAHPVAPACKGVPKHESCAASDMHVPPALSPSGCGHEGMSAWYSTARR